MHALKHTSNPCLGRNLVEDILHILTMLGGNCYTQTGVYTHWHTYDACHTPQTSRAHTHTHITHTSTQTHFDTQEQIKLVARYRFAYKILGGEEEGQDQRLSILPNLEVL
jgi:hypothetical protein